MHRSDSIPRMRRPSNSKPHSRLQPPSHQTPSVSFSARYTSVGPLPLSIDSESLEFVRQIQSFTCVRRSLVGLQGQQFFIYFESMEDAATFLETWIFLVDQMAAEDSQPGPCMADNTAPIQLRLVEGLSKATLLGLKQYLASFGSGGYLVADDGEGLSFIFVDSEDADLMRQQFAGVFQ